MSKAGVNWHTEHDCERPRGFGTRGLSDATYRGRCDSLSAISIVT